MTGFRLSVRFIAFATRGKTGEPILKLSLGVLGVKGNLDNLEKEGR